jgi:hypothetical protein
MRKNGVLDMTTHARFALGVFDDGDTRVMGAAYAIACDLLEANGEGLEHRALRAEIAAALLEVAEDGVRDLPALARAAVDLVYVDAIEFDFNER